MADENRASSGGPSDDPDTVLRELKKQAEYGKLFAATLTKDAAAIEGAVKALNKKNTRSA